MDVCINSMGSLFTIFFVDLEKVENLEDSLKANTENFSIYFNTMLDNGIVVPPSQFEAHFLSIAHTKKELDRTLEVMEMAFKKMVKKMPNKFFPVSIDLNNKKYFGNWCWKNCFKKSENSFGL